MLFHGQARQMHVVLNVLKPAAAKTSAGGAAGILSPVRGYPRITSMRLLSTKETAQGVASRSTPATIGTTTTTPVPAKGLRRYAEQFKDKPASHFVAFAILHEVTAVVPLPLVYFGLTYTDTKIPFPEQALEEGNKFVGRVAKYYGWDIDPSTTDGARIMLNMASSYALVKALLPMRVALCLWMTPWTATRIISPVMNLWRKVVKK
ncbi:hypothetical protein BGZ73_008334 [Actinomortierella ambigua]|nr:hypothetical protein BGZ73_008334 [Actinomortierella ambigua]